MKFRSKLLYFAGLIAAVALGFSTGQWLAVLALWIVLDSLLAVPMARCYANTLGTLGTATIVQEALDLVFTKRPILNNISLGFRDDKGSPIALFGQAVITRTKTIPAVSTTQTNSLPAAPNADVTTDVSVTLNNQSSIWYQFLPGEYSGTNRDLIREAAEPLAVAIANQMVDNIASVWTPANYPNKTIAAAGWSYAHLVAVRQILQTRGVPDMGNRFYVGNAAVYASLLQDPLIIAAFNNPANGEAIKRGLLPMVAGMRLDEYVAIATASATPSLVGFSGTPDSTVYAARVPKDPREILPNAPFPGSLGVITEPRTGMSLMLSEWIDAATLNANIRLNWMWGTAVGNANNGQLITTQ